MTTGRINMKLTEPELSREDRRDESVIQEKWTEAWDAVQHHADTVWTWFGIEDGVGDGWCGAHADINGDLEAAAAHYRTQPGVYDVEIDQDDWRSLVAC